MRRIGPAAVGCAQMFVMGPSVSNSASHLPSGESTGCIKSQFESRDPEIRANCRGEPSSGFAMRICMSDKPFTAWQIHHEEQPAFCINGRLLSLLAHQTSGTAVRRRITPNIKVDLPSS